jgi:hypothetical protein
VIILIENKFLFFKENDWTMIALKGTEIGLFLKSLSNVDFFQYFFL